MTEFILPQLLLFKLEKLESNDEDNNEFDELLFEFVAADYKGFEPINI